MIKYKFVFVLSFLFGSLFSSAAHAQSAIALTSQQARSGVTSTTSAGYISLDLTDVSLRTAIDEIAKRGDIKIAYGRSVEKSSLRVSIKESKIIPTQAIQRILRGTRLSLTSYEGRLAIIDRDSDKSSQGVITGKIVDVKTGKAITGVTVSVDADNRGVLTDETGSYRIANVSSGTHTIVARLLGYAKQTKSVTVGENAALSVDFKLEPTANVLDQVVVTGTVAATELKAVPNAMTIITAKQIEERGITRLEQLFRGDVPGVFAINVMSGTATDNYGQVVLFSRGATAINNVGGNGSAGINAYGLLTSNMKMYVNGVQLSDSSLKFLGQIDPKSIERIEILTGPQASTVYGAGAINGVMQIFTKKGNTRRPQFALSFQSGMSESNYKKHIELNNYVTNLSLSGLEGRVSYRMGTSWNHDGSWIASQQTNTFGGDGSVNVSIGSKITVASSARLSRRFSSVKGTPGGTTPFGALQAGGVIAPGSGGIIDETAITKSQGGGLTFNYTQFPWWSHNATLGFDGNTYGRYQPSPKYGSISDTSIQITDRPGSNISQSYSSTMQLPLLALANLNLTFGGDHTRSDMGNLGWYGFNQITGKLFTVPADNGGNIQAFLSKPNRHSGAFVQGTFGIKDALFLTYGVRMDWDPAYGEDANVTPGRYGATFNQSFGSLTAKLRGSYGKAVRAPKRDLTKGYLVGANQWDIIDQYGRIYSILPNPELVPEDQQGGEGGVDLYWGNRGSLSVTRYNQTTDNLIERFGADSVRSLQTFQDYLLSAYQEFYACDLLESWGYSCGYSYYIQDQALNVGSIRNQGWELAGTMNLGPITTNGTYSWTKSRVIGITPKYRNLLPNYAGANFQVGAPFNYMPEHSWAFGMTYSNSTSTISLNFTGHGTNLIPIGQTILGITTSSSNRFTYTRERMGTPQGVASLAVPGYGNADLYARHRFSTRINATLNVTNLTNYYKNDYNATFPSVGRQTRLGANLIW